ncbi:hypothetical protein G7Y89_g7797 [Cudoniella acicularis]|uniref:Major facilitator superfamily (MFS) profile domain-containing protein n=1 Tax=Cudoniella acicularis TaxID=354080 RepID=A0A8H4RHU2_9HELO|nr:hypothetical protein G7Y89_g7797 [Cudoniella acicularis]
MEKDIGIDRMESINTGTKHNSIGRIQTLGSVRHRDAITNDVILIPTPSKDPNDPLNWSQGRKYYTAGLVCLAMFMCNFLAAGPTVAIVDTTFDFFPNAPMGGPAVIAAKISKVAFFFTSTALLQGLGNLFWMPLFNKYGKRPVYIASYTLYFGTTIWLSFTSSYASFLIGRIVMGFAAGAAECTAPPAVFFLHERGTIMAFYTAALSCGVAGGILISGLITIHHTWRYIYYVAVALVGLVLLLAIFTFPETTYIRETPSTTTTPPDDDKIKPSISQLEMCTSNSEIPKRMTYWQSLRVYSGVYTSENLWTLFSRCIVLIVLPPVLWSAMIMSVTIGFLVAVTSNVAPAYSTTYGFAAWQTGLCFIAALVGSIIGIVVGGHMGDWVADWFTKRNGGLREPEMRLPAIVISLITAPLASILYGVGIQYQLHWICPTIGLGLLNFSIVQATNISLVYVIDVYRPIAGECTVTVMAAKWFLLSFYTNPWVDAVGYLNAYGTMAAISAFFILLTFPLYIFGKRIRTASWKWRVVKFVHWNADREVGE